ncbi:MAG: hypothetical protein KY475_21155 [Planctomycetes bacterium]|nr:hypothetical protein [Planctomycetota bacterium]
MIMVLRIRDPDRREQAIHRLENQPSEEALPRIYEMNIGDWDAGLWEEELEWFTELLDGTRDRIIVWRFAGNSYIRFTIGEGA